MNSVLFILKRKGYSIFEFLFLNYYWVITVGGLFWLATGRAWLDATLIPLLVYILLFAGGRVKNKSILDFLWWLCFLWGVMTWIFNDYPHKPELIIRCISEQLAYMLAYWVVRKNERINMNTIIKAAYLPLIITTIIGIYCFIFEPAWYASRTKDFTTDFEEFEFKRLRSIFMDGYVIMYMCAIVVIYEFFLLSKGQLSNKKSIKRGFIKRIKNNLAPTGEPMHLIFIGLCCFAIFLGIQRSAIAAIIAGLFLSIYYSWRYTSIKNVSSLLVIAMFSLFICVAAIINMEGEQQLFYIDKVLSVTEDSQSLASERLVHNKNVEYTLIGDGMGRHNLYADQYNPYTSLRDGEYNKLMTEQGYIGAFLYLLFCLCAILKSCRNFRYLGFELAMIFALLISMIGANPISTFDKHPILFWMIFGQIANFDSRRQVCCG